MTKMLVFTLHLKVDAKLTTVKEITRNLFIKQAKSDSSQMPEGKIMTLKEAIQKDSQRHLYMKSAITFGTTQYI